MLTLSPAAGANLLRGQVLSSSYLGGRVIYEINIGSGVIRANLPIGNGIAQEGESIEVGFAAADCVLL
jgi:hypothetical protein